MLLVSILGYPCCSTTTTSLPAVQLQVTVLFSALDASLPSYVLALGCDGLSYVMEESQPARIPPSTTLVLQPPWRYQQFNCG
jgi:hypothetical protein